MIISILHGVLLDRRIRKEINMRSDKEEVMKKSKRERRPGATWRDITQLAIHEGNIL